MKSCLIAVGTLSLLTLVAVASEESMLARITVYWAEGGAGSDKWTRNHQAATRVRLHAGHCAVDPGRIPYGSKVTLPDGALVAVDTGKHVKSRRAARLGGKSCAEKHAIVIDRFFETKAQALAWAKHNPAFMTVRVSSPNESFAPAPSAAPNVVSASPRKKYSPRLAQKKLAPIMLATRTAILPAAPETITATPTSHYPSLRNSIATLRTDVDRPARGSIAAVAAQPQPAPAAGSVSRSKLLADNSAPSHYGRAVAYLP